MYVEFAIPLSVCHQRDDGGKRQHFTSEEQTLLISAAAKMNGEMETENSDLNRRGRLTRAQKKAGAKMDTLESAAVSGTGGEYVFVCWHTWMIANISLSAAEGVSSLASSRPTVM